MAHFAQLDDNNIVLQVIVVNNNELLDENGNELENKGKLFCTELFGGNWIQSSYNTRGGIHYNSNNEPDQKNPFRKNHAQIGYIYDASKDAFIPPKPFGSWVLNEDSCLWEPPISYPNDGKVYEWNEEIKNWVEING